MLGKDFFEWGWGGWGVGGGGGGGGGVGGGGGGWGGEDQILPPKKFTKHSFPFVYYQEFNLRLGISIFEQLYFLCFL